MSGKPQPEKLLQKQILRHLQTRGDVFVWPNRTGMLKAVFAGGRMGLLQYGYKGSADILGVMRGGRFLAVEVKRPGNVRLTADQLVFAAAVRDKGGLYIVATSVEDVERGLAEPYEVIGAGRAATG